MSRHDGRADDELRAMSFERDYTELPAGSVLVCFGRTRVLCTASVDTDVPRWLRGSGKGWVTAEYSMLPGSTADRVPREAARGRQSGRTQEIQRLIGRALRNVTNLALFPNKTLIVDVDVLQADGGTRCAGVLAGYAALHEAANKLIYSGELAEWPLLFELGAVSTGVIAGEDYVDLEYSEDVAAEADLNVIATGDGQVVEVQGGGEQQPLPAEHYVSLVAMGVSAVELLLERVRPQLK